MLTVFETSHRTTIETLRDDINRRLDRIVNALETLKIGAAAHTIEALTTCIRDLEKLSSTEERNTLNKENL